MQKKSGGKEGGGGAWEQDCPLCCAGGEPGNETVPYVSLSSSSPCAGGESWVQGSRSWVQGSRAWERDCPLCKPLFLLPLCRGSEDIHLAVLHPRELRVHSLVSMETEQGPQYSLSLAYRHQLQRTACNMVIGPFGTRG